MTIQEFFTATKKADQDVASDGALEPGYNQVLNDRPFHVTTKGIGNPLRATAPIQSVKLAKKGSSTVLVLVVDDQTMVPKGDTKNDGAECLAVNQIITEVRRLVAVTVRNGVLTEDECLDLKVFVDAGGKLVLVKSVGRKLTSPRNARICLN